MRDCLKHLREKQLLNTGQYYQASLTKCLMTAPQQSMNMSCYMKACGIPSLELWEGPTWMTMMTLDYLPGWLFP